MAGDSGTCPRHRPRRDETIGASLVRGSDPRNGVRLRVHSRISRVRGPTITRTEHTVAVVSEAHVASHVPAIPGGGTCPTSVPAGAALAIIDDIELVAEADEPVAPATTWLAQIMVKPSASAPSNTYRHHRVATGGTGAGTTRG